MMLVVTVVELVCDAAGRHTLKEGGMATRLRDLDLKDGVGAAFADKLDGPGALGEDLEAMLVLRAIRDMARGCVDLAKQSHVVGRNPRVVVSRGIW